jgi:SH3-like domain-containing protein
MKFRQSKFAWLLLPAALSAFLLTAAPSAGIPASGRLAVSAAVANIRSGPGTQYEVLWQVEKYHPIEVLQTSGPWCQFRDFEGDRGWIHSSLVADIPTVITRQDGCNVRSGPGTDHPTVFTVDKGIPFKVVSRRGKWLEVEHADGDRGWIHSSLTW